MQTTLVIAVALHVLSGVFWAGSTFVLARGAASPEQLGGPQLGAAVFAVVTGGYLWHLTHRYSFQTPEELLALGIGCALAAGIIQGTVALGASRRLARADAGEQQSLHGRITISQRAAAALLAITVICMASARYV